MLGTLTFNVDMDESKYNTIYCDALHCHNKTTLLVVLDDIFLNLRWKSNNPMQADQGAICRVP